MGRQRCGRFADEIVASLNCQSGYIEHMDDDEKIEVYGSVREADEVAVFLGDLAREIEKFCRG